MITLGIVLSVLGLIFGLGLLVSIGLFLLIVGLILNVIPIRGQRRRYW